MLSVSTFLRRAASLCVLGCAGLSLKAQQQAVPTFGKEFWVGFMDNHSYFTPLPTLTLHISSAVNTSGVVRVPLAGIAIPFTVVPGAVTMVQLQAADLMHTTSEVVEQKGVLVTSADAIAVYASNMLHYTTDAWVVHPIALLGTQHRVFCSWGSSDVDGLPPAHQVSEFLIVAAHDGTQVEIQTTEDTEGGHISGTPWVVQLDSGETYQVRSNTPVNDLSGSSVRGIGAAAVCKPFAVFSGAVCGSSPNLTNCGSCDHLCDQDLPTDRWGTTIHTVPFANVVGQYMLRILVAQDGTQVSVPGVPLFVLNAGAWMQLGTMTDPLCITATGPFAVAQFMQGITCAQNGDPSMVILNAEEQRLTRATFSTIITDITVDPVTAHFVNVVMPTAGTGSLLLDGLGVPPSSFTAYPECPATSFAQLPITAGDHSLESPAGFSAYVYGMGVGEAESYSYSVGGSYPELPSTTVPPQLTITANGDSTATVCAGAVVQLDVAADPAGDHVYTWSPEAMLDDAGIADPQATMDSTTWFHVRVALANGCGAAKDSVLVTVSFSERIALADTAFCLGDSVLLDAGMEADGYLWNTGDTVRTIMVDTAGAYTVQLSDASGCTAADTVQVTEDPLPVVDLGPDTAVCRGLVLTLDAQNPGATYQWSTGAITRSIGVDDEEVRSYGVRVTDEAGCSGLDTVKVDRYPLPLPVLPGLLAACLAEPPYHALLDAGNGDCTFRWNAGDTAQVIVVRAYGTFVVRITTPHGCELEQATAVLEDCTNAIYLPNSFTPDADGVNDLFMPVGTDIATVRLSIFDRWGELIHDGEQGAAAWDGTYKGRPVKDEVYTWRLRYRFSDPLLRTGVFLEQERYGTVTVLR